MFETDADRLSMIRALGGVDVSGPLGTFCAIFDADHVGLGDVPVDSLAPRLTCRSSDLERCGVREGVALTIGADTYVARSPHPDGLGITTIDLEGP